MPTPQSGILPEANQNALFLLFRRRIGRRASPKLKTMLACLPERTVVEAEINPLIVKAEGQGVVAVDGLIVFAENARS